MYCPVSLMHNVHVPGVYLCTFLCKLSLSLGNYQTIFDLLFINWIKFSLVQVIICFLNNVIIDVDMK